MRKSDGVNDGDEELTIGRRAGGAGAFSGGWTLRDTVLIGAEFDLWSTINTDVTPNIYNLLGTLTWSPDIFSGRAHKLDSSGSTSAVGDV